MIFNILSFGFKVLKQVILPNKHRKGNLVSSVFLFFIGLIAEISLFEKSVFQNSKLLRHRYIRQSLVFAASLLFLVSSFEWTAGNICPSSPVEISVLSVESRVAIASISGKEKKVIGALAIKERIIRYFPLSTYFPFKHDHSAALKKFLLYNTLRI